MSPKLPLIGGVILVLLGVLAYSATFTVYQTQQAIVLQFGDPKETITEPGLHFKLPFVQEVVYVEKRVLNLDPPAATIILGDQLRLVVDSFVRFRIVDPLRFIQVAGSEATLQGTVGSIVNDNTRAVLGDATLSEVLSSKRGELMADIRQRVNRQAERYGIQIVDMRIGRADLAEDVRESVYARMRAERERDAADYRAQGQETFQRITSQADRDATIIKAEADREANILRGEGDAEKTRILNEAYGKDPEFFQFYRTMQAYQNSIDPQTSFFVLTTDSEFFRYFQDVAGGYLTDVTDGEGSPSGDSSAGDSASGGSTGDTSSGGSASGGSSGGGSSNSDSSSTESTTGGTTDSN